MTEKSQGAASSLRLAVDNGEIRAELNSHVWGSIPPNVSLSLFPNAHGARSEANIVSIVAMSGKRMSDIEAQIQFSRPRVIVDARTVPSFTALSAQSSRTRAFRIFDSVGANYLDLGELVARGGVASRQVKEAMKGIFEDVLSAAPVNAMIFAHDRSDAFRAFLVVGLAVALISTEQQWTIGIY
jgi:hypothetical protein